jgi:hypothetical protein
LLKIRGNGIETKINEDFIFEYEAFGREFLRVGATDHLREVNQIEYSFASRKLFAGLKHSLKGAIKRLNAHPVFLNIDMSSAGFKP